MEQSSFVKEAFAKTLSTLFEILPKQLRIQMDPCQDQYGTNVDYERAWY